MSLTITFCYFDALLATT